MLFDKNGEVLSYDESDIFCEELAFRMNIPPIAAI